MTTKVNAATTWPASRGASSGFSVSRLCGAVAGRGPKRAIRPRCRGGPGTSRPTATDLISWSPPPSPEPRDNYYNTYYHRKNEGVPQGMSDGSRDQCSSWPPDPQSSTKPWSQSESSRSMPLAGARPTLAFSPSCLSKSPITTRCSGTHITILRKLLS